MNFVPVNEPILDGNEKKYLCECIDTGWISSAGAFVEKFESDLAARCSREYGISVTNGTAALEVAVASLNLEAGSEVIMPAFTIVSCCNAIIKAGLTPVLVDADPITWNMDVDQIEKRITDKTRAIMVVHIYGLPVNMGTVLEIANKYNLIIIEDAAEAQGLLCDGKECGGFGDVSVMSFFANKHITTGEGGMVLTNNPRIAERAKQIRNLYFDVERRYIHEEIGSNFRMTNIQAAIGCAQLEKLDQHLQIKKKIGDVYNQKLNVNEYLQKPCAKTEYADNVYWVYGLVVKDSDVDADYYMIKLKDMGIGTRHFFTPMHQQPAFLKRGLFKDERYPIAEKLAKKGFYIPSGMAMTDDQMECVINAVNVLCK